MVTFLDLIYSNLLADYLGIEPYNVCSFKHELLLMDTAIPFLITAMQ